MTHTNKHTHPRVSVDDITDVAPTDDNASCDACAEDVFCTDHIDAWAARPCYHAARRDECLWCDPWDGVQ